MNRTALRARWVRDGLAEDAADAAADMVAAEKWGADATGFGPWLVERKTFDKAHLRDLYLCFACLEGAPAAVEHFLASVLRPAARRAPAEARDDLVGRLSERLLVGAKPRLASYAGRSALSAWVAMVVKREVVDAKRTSERRGQDGHGDDTGQWSRLLSGGVPGLESDVAGRQAGRALDQALRAALSELPASERALLQRHYLRGEPHHRLAEEHGVPRSTMALRLTRLRDALLHRVKELLLEGGVSPRSLSSFIRAGRRALDERFDGDQGPPTARGAKR